MSKRKAQPKRRSLRTAVPIDHKKAHELILGDVIYWDHQRAIVIEEPAGPNVHDENTLINGTPAWAVSQFRVAYFTDSGNVSHRGTYVTVPTDRDFIIADRLPEAVAT